MLVIDLDHVSLVHVVEVELVRERLVPLLGLHGFQKVCYVARAVSKRLGVVGMVYFNQQHLLTFLHSGHSHFRVFFI